MIAYNIVKIKQCNNNRIWCQWYKDLIGTELKVSKVMHFNNFRVYQVVEPLEYTFRIILQDDCEFIKAL